MFQQVTVVGYLGRDPESRFLNSGQQVTSIRVATSQSWKDKNTGERKERTEWFNVEIWGASAAFASNNMRSGDLVLVTGEMRTDSYEKDGETRYVSKLRARNVRLVVAKAGRIQRSNRDDGGSPKGNAPAKPAQAPLINNDDDLEDDIPF